jgi:hypothetical protein
VVQDNEDYSDYSRHVGTNISGLMILNGFIFTVITLLLTRLDQPLTLYPQLFVLFLTTLFDLNGFLAQHLGVETLYLCKNIPPQTRKIAIRTKLMFLSFSLFGLSIPFMFLLFDLTFLAIASTVAWLLVLASSQVLVYKPLREFRVKHRG